MNLFIKNKSIFIFLCVPIIFVYIIEMYSFLGNQDASGYDEIYYNCDIVNGRTIDQGSSTDPVVKFNETRDSPIIKDASKYDFAIVRFTMDGAGKDLPVWIPVIEQGLTPTNAAEQLVALTKSVYKITLRVVVNGVEYISREFPLAPTHSTAGAGAGTTEQGNSLMFVPEDKAAEPPFAAAPIPPTIPAPQKTTTQDLSGRYYYISSFSQVVGMVNATFKQAWLDLERQFNHAGGGHLYTHAPIMTYDATTGRFSIHCDNYGWGSNGYGGAGATLDAPVMLDPDNTRSNTLVGSTQTENWDMFFNSNMYGLFANFPMKYWGGDAQTNNRTYQILTHFPTLSGGDTAGAPAKTMGGSVGLLGSGADADNNQLYDSSGNRIGMTYPGGLGLNVEMFVIEQDYKSTGTLWSPIASIVFTTTLIPVVNEFVGEPQRFGDSNDTNNSTTQNAFQPIITDIALPTDTAADYRKFLEYVPSAEYRMISLSSSNQEIKNIDIQVFWKNRLDGSLVPVEMFNLSSISVKMLFRKRK